LTLLVRPRRALGIPQGDPEAAASFSTASLNVTRSVFITKSMTSPPA
jgi:hypothetical protein